MKLKDKIIVVTGGANGIGFALCKRFVREKAKVVLSDKNESMALERAGEIGATAISADVCKEKEIKNLISVTNDLHGRIDVFVSGAGYREKGGAESTARKWKQTFNTNLMAHVYAAKFVLPQMLERGSGHLLNVVSAVPFDVQSAPFTASEYAAIGFSQWLDAKYSESGIRVHLLLSTYLNNQNEFSEAEEITDFAIKSIAGERILKLTDQEWLHFFKPNHL